MPMVGVGVSPSLSGGPPPAVTISVVEIPNPAAFTPPAGRATLAVLGVQVGSTSTWYRGDGDPADTGTLLSGSDTELVEDQSITRIRWGSNRITLNDDPSDVNMSDTFGDDGVAADAWFHLIHEGTQATLDIADITAAPGNNFLRLSVGSSGDFHDLADQVATGDYVIFAITVPESALAPEDTGNDLLWGTQRLLWDGETLIWGE